MTLLTPKPASTVILCNITTEWPYKVLLIKRSDKSKFLPGAHVFPGGCLDSSLDKRLGAILARDQQNFSRIKKYFPFGNTMIGEHLAAAIRETLEESGISILQCMSGVNNAGNRNYLLTDLIQQLNKETSSPVLANIWPVSWWITPDSEVRRFDTWFFLSTVEVDEGYYIDHSSSEGEVLDRRWYFPNCALNAYGDGKIFLAPPTRAILERMAACNSLSEFLSFVDCPMRPIKPFFIENDDRQKILILPGDHLHADQNSSLIMKTRYFFP